MYAKIGKYMSKLCEAIKGQDGMIKPSKVTAS